MKWLRLATLLSVHGCVFTPEATHGKIYASLLVCVWIGFEAFRMLKKNWKNQINTQNN